MAGGNRAGDATIILSPEVPHVCLTNVTHNSNETPKFAQTIEMALKTCDGDATMIRKLNQK